MGRPAALCRCLHAHLRAWAWIRVHSPWAPRELPLAARAARIWPAPEQARLRYDVVSGECSPCKTPGRINGCADFSADALDNLRSQVFTRYPRGIPRSEMPQFPPRTFGDPVWVRFMASFEAEEGGSFSNETINLVTARPLQAEISGLSVDRTVDGMRARLDSEEGLAYLRKIVLVRIPSRQGNQCPRRCWLLASLTACAQPYGASFWPPLPARRSPGQRWAPARACEAACVTAPIWLTFASTGGCCCCAFAGRAQPAERKR